jgi:hypothetical protein
VNIAVDVNLDVDVAAPVSVAALVKGNDAVAVINARGTTSTQFATLAGDIAGMLHFQRLAVCPRAIEFLTGGQTASVGD